MQFKIFNQKITSVHAAALIIGAAGFLSRILGLFRDRLLASRFGAGDTLDAYYAAFQIPDTLFTVFLIGAASAAILPVFIDYREHGRDSMALIQKLLTIFSVLAALSVLVLIIASPSIVPLIVPGFSPEKAGLATALTRIMMLSPFFLGVAGIISSVLQAYHRFLVYAVPPIFYNLAIIFGIIVLVPVLGPTGLAWGVALGALLQVLVQLPLFFRLGFRPNFSFNLRDPGVKKIFRISLPRVAALSFNQITLLVLVGITSFLTAGSVSVFKFAINLIYFPIGLFGVSYALAIFPKLSERVVKNQGNEFFSELSAGMRSVIFWSLPITFLFVVLRAHIVRVILGAGHFNWNDTRLVAASMAALSFMILFEGLNTLLIRAFYALEKTREPLIVNIVASLATVLTAVGLLGFFAVNPEALRALSYLFRVGDLAATQVLGIAIAFSFGSTLNFMLLFSKLRKTSVAAFGINTRRNFRHIAKIFLASAIGGFAAYGALLPFPALLPTNTFFGIALQGISAGISGFAAYFAALYIMHSEEFLSLLESFRLRLYSTKKQPEIFEIEKLDGQESGK